MNIQTTFKRYELKYLLSPSQYESIREQMALYMTPDQYAKSSIRNLYFDTDNYRLIRHCLLKPAYKEKLRLRSYSRAESDSPVFVELKKKYSGVVYKRRLVLPQQEAIQWLCGAAPESQDSQIAREIGYFCRFYGGLHPAVFLSYDRLAFCAADGTDFRVTFDDNILFRQNELTLASSVYGTPLLPPETVLMELKTSGGIPLWMSHILTRERIFKTSYSKYGTAYCKYIFKNYGGIGNV